MGIDRRVPNTNGAVFRRKAAQNETVLRALFTIAAHARAFNLFLASVELLSEAEWSTMMPLPGSFGWTIANGEEWKVITNQIAKRDLF